MNQQYFLTFTADFLNQCDGISTNHKIALKFQLFCDWLKKIFVRSLLFVLIDISYDITVISLTLSLSFFIYYDN